jgi:hypothetical protein
MCFSFVLITQWLKQFNDCLLLMLLHVGEERRRSKKIQFQTVYTCKNVQRRKKVSVYFLHLKFPSQFQFSIYILDLGQGCIIYNWFNIKFHVSTHSMTSHDDFVGEFYLLFCQLFAFIILIFLLFNS